MKYAELLFNPVKKVISDLYELAKVDTLKFQHFFIAIVLIIFLSASIENYLNYSEYDFANSQYARTIQNLKTDNIDNLQTFYQYHLTEQSLRTSYTRNKALLLTISLLIIIIAVIYFFKDIHNRDWINTKLGISAPVLLFLSIFLCFFMFGMENAIDKMGKIDSIVGTKTEFNTKEPVLPPPKYISDYLHLKYN